MRLDKGRHCEIDRSRFRKLRTKHLLESRGREGTREGFGPKCNFDILEWRGQFVGGNSLCRENPKKRKKSVKEFFHLKAEHVLINAFLSQIQYPVNSDSAHFPNPSLPTLYYGDF